MRPLRHEGYKVHTVKPSIQGSWVPNMWGNHPKHAMAIFRTMPTLEFSDLSGIMKKNVKRKPKDSLVRKLKRSTNTLVV